MVKKNRIKKENMELDIKVPNRQSTPFGCGMYAVANALNLNNYATNERLIESKQGNLISKLTKWLIEDGQNLGVDILYYNHKGGKLPEDAMDYVPIGEDVNLLPVMLAVRFSDESLNHMVAGKVDKSGTLFLYDSMKENVIKTTLREVNNLYHEVYGLYLFLDIDNGSYAFIK